MALPRKFLNEDEELLAELRPHWIFLFGPLFTSLGTWAAIVAILIVWQHAPGWTNYPFLILALVPGLWLLGRYLRWRSYVIALTSTRILVRQGILGRDTVQLRLQRITEVNISQTLIERVLGTGRIIIDVQGEDDSLTLEYIRKPAVVQRVINSQINEIVGGGHREPVPDDLLPHDEWHARGDADGHGHGPRIRVRRAPIRHAPLGNRRASRFIERGDAVGVAHEPRRGPAFGRGIRRSSVGRSLRDPRPPHRARRPPASRHHLRGGVRIQEERAPQSDLSAT